MERIGVQRVRNWTLAGVVVVLQVGCGLEPDSSGRSESHLEADGESAWTTWTCTSAPCPWGSETSNHALSWPAAASPVTARLGYTASPAPYLPAAAANGLTISVDLGSAGVFAGAPGAGSHRWLGSVSPGQDFDVSGLASGEVLSVQSDDSFRYHVTATPSPPPDDPPPDDPPPDDPPPPPPPPASGDPSQTVTWTCTSTPCPWGSSLSGEALVWPDDAEALHNRLGYTTSRGVYLPAERANGATITIDSGTASAYAGVPGGASHRWLANIGSGQTFEVSGLPDGEVVSIQADAPFRYRAVLPAYEPDPEDGPPHDAIQATQAIWRCNTPDCHGPDWTGAVITWPSSVAYQSNGRSGDNSRSVTAPDGTPLHPYMGAWANGCKVTAASGTVIIIEWQRGTDAWRETWLSVGQSHVIALASPEDGAMIETYEGSPGFSVSLESCTPAPLL
ncbi:MAG TPA: hypothetical protein VLM79_10775 [Kofleriaceae bacterium]|nr:hypothetical protein [Kofleriaceae bacterium]